MTRPAQNTDRPGVRRWGLISEERRPIRGPIGSTRPPLGRPRGVRFHPGALRRDVMIPLYDPPGFLGGAREERKRSGVTLGSWWSDIRHRPQTLQNGPTGARPDPPRSR